MEWARQGVHVNAVSPGYAAIADGEITRGS